MVATESVVDRMRTQVSAQLLDGFWRKGFPGQIAERPPVAEPLARDTIDLEGEQLVAVGLGHTDTGPDEPCCGVALRPRGPRLTAASLTSRA